MNPRTSESTHYQHPLRHYAELYNRSLSSIKRYARAKAPLDDPETMSYYLALQKDTGRAGVRLSKLDALDCRWTRVRDLASHRRLVLMWDVRLLSCS